MFEQEMERLEHEIDDALLFYYAASCPEEKKKYFTRVVESSLERLQHCLEEVRKCDVSPEFRENLTRHLHFFEHSLQKGVSEFPAVTSGTPSYWDTLISAALPTYTLVEEYLNSSRGTGVRCS